MLNAAILANKEQLAPYAQRLLEGLAPVFARLDETKLAATSSIEIRKERHGWMLDVRIDAADPDIPCLSLRADSSQCTVGFADGDQIEVHSDPDTHLDLVPAALQAITAYLSGITIVEHYNKNSRVVKSECFLGVERNGQALRPIGTSTYPLQFPKKISSSKTTVFQFVK